LISSEGKTKPISFNAPFTSCEKSTAMPEGRVFSELAGWAEFSPQLDNKIPASSINIYFLIYTLFYKLSKKNQIVKKNMGNRKLKK
jgi:hypothetical protein